MKKQVFTLLCFLTANIVSADQVNFSGVLRNAIPCNINSDSDLIVPFNEISDKDLYKKKDVMQPFDITLSDCEYLPDFSYSMAFTGIENSNIKGAVAIDSDNGSAGYGIKLMNEHGEVQLNEHYPLQIDTKNGFPTIIAFKAYILAEEDAINNKSIQLGDFTATTTFNIYYE
ncbi:fimbrial protein [Providencia huaxiensis]|uniref:Type 1 fimbrial protein n=1 Tax=Providencia huaxiensis TaxID=2027290 RepID=A0A8I2AEA2_9GAMM|nr:MULTISPECIES: fimbrial protein [Providencia]MBN6361253.1 type 1 fimbrial protein [Providencia huaxiensis]MBQ0267430.1 type 1 fimbrial protein [Providencia huaxiensis]MBQ0533787.1 type 1 fimbrial protein [Providencia huaxiensis]MBQ0588481.1 type 1 fimbrial protein [Providencia huaxiensis]MCG9535057.1 type 1 fimbrial protein [Providencia huaxiensis]